MSYKVKKGDTLSKIAKENNMSLNELLELNGISKDKANHISIGQEIKITKDPNSVDFSQIGFKSPYPITMDWKSYHTDDKSMPAPFKEGYTEDDYIKDNAETIQKQLKEAGYHLGTSGKNKDGVDGSWGKNSQAALDKALSEGYKLENGKLIAPEKDSINPILPKVLSDSARFVTNFAKAPVQATVDGLLYAADIAGAPSNATNYLRDLNVSLPYRGKAAVKAGFKTIMGNKSWEENYQDALANPGILTRASSIKPLTNTNFNFSNEELEVLRDMAGSDFNITNGDIKRVSENKRYGGKGALREYFSPTKVVQTAIGQSSGNADKKLITDIFDVNTVGEVAEKDNAMYERLAAESPGIGYEDLRATMPRYNMIDIIPDQYKIHTRVRYEK